MTRRTIIRHDDFVPGFRTVIGGLALVDVDLDALELPARLHAVDQVAHHEVALRRAVVHAGSLVGRNVHDFQLSVSCVNRLRTVFNDITPHACGLTARGNAPVD
jgi:hypothetical protein